MKKNLLNILLFSCLSLFVLLVILILVVDVQIHPYTLQNVGLYSLNELFIFNNNSQKMWDIMSDVFMYIAIAGVLVVACLGAYQLVKNKSFKKVDSEIILLGGFIIILAVAWILFDKFVVINHRPIIVDGEIEGSFPSTHVMLVTFVYLALGQFLKLDSKPNKVKYVYYVSASIVIVITSLGRILSSMHWFTDVLGGILLGLTLYFAYLKVIGIIKEKGSKNLEHN